MQKLHYDLIGVNSTYLNT